MDFTGTFLLVLNFLLLFLSSTVLAKGIRKQAGVSVQCEPKLGKLAIKMKSGVVPTNSDDFKIRALATYQISNRLTCLKNCLIHKSRICRSIVQMKARKGMACVLYSESYIEHPERFMEQKGTIFTELTCDYGSMLVAGPLTVSGNERHGSFGKYTVNVHRKPILGALKKVLNISREEWNKAANDFDPSEAVCVIEAVPLITNGNALQFKRPDKGQIVCKIFGNLENA